MRTSTLEVEGYDSPVTRNPVPDAMIRHHVRDALSRGLPELAQVEPHGRTMVIAGSGPSLRLLPPWYSEGVVPYDIFALGGAHDWLIKRGVVPHAWINSDPLPIVAQYVSDPHPDVTYYIGSHSHRFVFETLASSRAVLWHGEILADTREIVEQNPIGKMRTFVMGGSNGAMRAPFIGDDLGYRKFIYFGVDSSVESEAEQLRIGPSVEVKCAGRTWVVPSNHVRQALELERIVQCMPEWHIEVRGEGLLAAMLAELQKMKDAA